MCKSDLTTTKVSFAAPRKPRRVKMARESILHTIVHRCRTSGNESTWCASAFVRSWNPPRPEILGCIYPIYTENPNFVFWEHLNSWSIETLSILCLLFTPPARLQLILSWFLEKSSQQFQRAIILHFDSRLVSIYFHLLHQFLCIFDTQQGPKSFKRVLHCKRDFWVVPEASWFLTDAEYLALRFEYGKHSTTSICVFPRRQSSPHQFVEH